MLQFGRLINGTSTARGLNGGAIYRLASFGVFVFNPCDQGHGSSSSLRHYGRGRPAIGNEVTFE
jgi:hypothetical protein